jgi:multidrug efflux pump subunit AcrA (membrane-fusion protein)
MRIRFRFSARWLYVGAIVVAAGVGLALSGRWLPAAARLVGVHAADASHEDHDEADGDHDAADEHGHAPGEASSAGTGNGSQEPYDHEHDEAAALKLSKQAEDNIGVNLAEVKLAPFERTISIPATVIQRPGRSQVKITALFTGLVTRIYRIEGEAVTPGMPLFDLQLTHEELVEAQASILRTVEELDVIQREVDRLSAVAKDGAIAGKTLLEREYEQQKLAASLRAQRQRLLLHRLTPAQIDAILKDRRLLDKVTVTVPEEAGETAGGAQPVLQLQRLQVEKGQHVAAGETLGVLADYSELYIEGKAFEQDIPALTTAAANGWKVAAVFESGNGTPQRIADLDILYLANEVDVQSRAFLFYVTLPNKQLVRDAAGGRDRFIGWQFKPGQRARLMVPVERWEQRIVLPVNAVVQDGAESYVFEHNRDHFDRRSVHVEYRDQDWAVIAGDGSLKPGVTVAVGGAYQLHLAAKNKGGSGVDPHAGHSH